MIFLVILLVALIAIILYMYFRPHKDKAATQAPYLDGLIALLDNNEDLALKKLKEAIGIDTDLTDAYIRLGDLFRKKGDIERAIQIHQSLTVRPTLKKDEEKKVYFALIQDYIAANRPNKSIAFLKEILKIDKNDRAAWNMVVRIYEDLMNYQDCVAAFEENPSAEFRDQKRYAFCLASLGNSKLKETTEENPEIDKEVMTALKKALRVDPESLAGLFYLAEYYRSREEYKKVRELYLKITGQIPDYTFLIIPGLEKVFYDLGLFDEIIPLYERVFRDSPKNFSVGFALANLYEKKNDLESARDIYRKISDLYPKNVISRLNLLRLATEDKAIRRELTDLIKVQTESKYACQKCGHSTAKFAFTCPKCHALESFLPSL
jgi:lipopolysaccharide biosynthesis regulator YciM